MEVAGFDVQICTDGQEGESLLRQTKFDLLILDIMLPGKDGLQILRGLQEGKEIPVLLVSAKKEEIDKIKGFSLGADDYITKPFSPEIGGQSEGSSGKLRALKRTIQSTGKNQNRFTIRGLKIDKDARQYISIIKKLS